MDLTELDRALGDTHRILLDTNALIAYHSEREAVHPLAVHLLRRIENASDPLTGYLSVVSAVELLVRPLQAGHKELTLMHTFLAEFPNLTVLPTDMPIAMQAATLRAISRLRLPDAVIIATSLLAGCEVVVSNDEEWKRKMEPLFREFKWVYLGDFLKS